MAGTLISRIRSDARGVVMLEFLLAFMPLFLIFLGTTQLVLMYVADLVVRHAAISGTRAACVVLSDDSQRYGGELQGTIAEDGGSGDTLLTDILGMDLGATLWAKLAGPTKHPGPRLAAIRRAVSLPLAAIAPDFPVLPALYGMPGQHSSLARELGNMPMMRLGTAFMLYDALAVAVTFPSAPQSDTLLERTVPLTGDVTVRVTYLFHCGVPLGAALLCKSFEALEEDKGLYELDHAPSTAGQPLLRASPARFRVLRAEATLPMQYAKYSDEATQ